MGTIRLLSEELRNRIAAGEVVERPASVVKELIENALDAGARQIDIEIQGGGVEKISVRDDGKGMDSEDAVLALQRSATSKIRTTDDLFNLNSFGFRGEALASIAAVSDVILTTKCEEATHGLRVFGPDGVRTEPVAAPRGTEISVADLFATIPARRKFLKTAATENTRSIEMVELFALRHPEVAFRLKIDGRTVLDLPAHQGADAALQRITLMFGKEFAAQLFPFQYLGEALKMNGFLSHPHVHRRNRKNQRLFVNARPVTDRILFAAITEAYESLVPRGFYPDVFLFLDIAPDLVDVNVHPRKSEVKFIKERDVFLAVRGALLSALSGKKAELPQEMPWTLRSPAPPAFASSQTNLDFSSSKELFRKNISSIPNTVFAPRESFAPISRSEPGDTSISSEPPLRSWRIVGQIRNSFILIEGEEGLLILDQHAAHERVRYERLMREVREHKRDSQKLLIPQVFSLSAEEKQILEANQEAFTALGFEIREFSSTEVAVFAVPLGTEKLDFRENLKNLLHELESEAPEEGKTVMKPLERIATFAACRGAIKFGDPLTLPEMEALVADLAACDGFYACAHGRPVTMLVSYEEMEGRMGR